MELFPGTSSSSCSPERPGIDAYLYATRMILSKNHKNFWVRLFSLCSLLRFLSLSSTPVRLAIIPKKPTVPLLTFVLTIISGMLVRAIAGTKSPTRLMNSIAINFLSSSISFKRYKNSTGVISSNCFFRSDSSPKLCLSVIAIEMICHTIPKRNME